jgi:hypothetical protein
MPPNAIPKSVLKALWPTVPERSPPATLLARSRSLVNTEALIVEPLSTFPNTAGSINQPRSDGVWIEQGSADRPARVTWLPVQLFRYIR